MNQYGYSECCQKVFEVEIKVVARALNEANHYVCESHLVGNSPEEAVEKFIKYSESWIEMKRKQIEQAKQSLL